MTNGYDVIGDVHGSATKLEGLLGLMGYECSADGVWGHPGGRIAVFVGDIVDRNEHQLRSLEIARSMVEAGTALMVLGNHEFNAICYATPAGDGHLRERNAKNSGQHQAFLAEIPADSTEHREWISWFRRLPLWLDLDGLRVVHACWSDAHIELLRTSLGGDALLDDAAVVLAGTRGTAEYDAIEVILKGPEVDLPERLWYLDKDGHLRKNARYKWWGAGAMTLRDRAVFIPESKSPDGTKHPGFDDTPVPGSLPVPADGSPVIVGHYWNTGALALLAPRAACVDYSAGNGGPLVAYRWSGEPDLDPTNFIAFPPLSS